jgi:hypothetical protein
MGEFLYFEIDWPLVRKNPVGTIRAPNHSCASRACTGIRKSRIGRDNTALGEVGRCSPVHFRRTFLRVGRYGKVARNEFVRCAIGKNYGMKFRLFVKINPYHEFWGGGSGGPSPDLCIQIGELFRNSHRKSTQTLQTLPKRQNSTDIRSFSIYGISWIFISSPQNCLDFWAGVDMSSCVEDSVDLTHFLYTIGDGATLPSVPILFALPTDILTADKMGFLRLLSAWSALPACACACIVHALASWWWWVWRDAQSH